MIKVFTKQIVMTSMATIARDTKSLEDEVDGWVKKNARITPNNTQLTWFVSGANTYCSVLMDYDYRGT